jgi:ATP-dependent DNA helicase DinG
MPSRITPVIQSYLASEISAAGGREVCFVATLDSTGIVIEARAVARGTADMVLALPGIARAGQMVLHNHPSGVLEPSPPDLHVAARLHDGGVGFGILNNTADELYVVVEVAPPRRKRDSIRSMSSRRWVSADRSRRFSVPSKTVPASGTWRRTSATRTTTAESCCSKPGRASGRASRTWSRAGLGAANKERTIVSTNTINLQEQLVGKDLPVLARALEQGEYRPTWALLKGWRNYLCLSRLEQAMGHQQSLLEPERLQELVSLTEWASRTSDGTLADLPAPPTSEVWDEVAAESDICTRLRLSALRPLFSLPGPASCRRGRRRGRQPPPAHRRPRDPAGFRQLAGRGGASSVPAADSRRGPSPRGRRGRASRAPGDEPRRATDAGAIRAERAWTGAGPGTRALSFG